MAVFTLASKPAPGQEPTGGVHIAFKKDDEVIQIDYPSDPSCYYILQHDSDLDTLRTPLALQLGTLNERDVFDDRIGGRRQGFYRVIEVPQSDPLDSDGDGIDDVYELLHTAILDPLDSADASLDEDRDGRSNREEYETGTILTEREVAFDLQFITGTGREDAFGRQITEFLSLPVINDRGRIAITGAHTAGDGMLIQNLFTIAPGNKQLMPLMDPALEHAAGDNPPAQLFGQPQINQHDQVLALRGLFAQIATGFVLFPDIWRAYITYAEMWNGTETQRQPAFVTMGKNAQFGQNTWFQIPQPNAMVPAPFDWSSSLERLHAFPAFNQQVQPDVVVFARTAKGNQLSRITSSDQVIGNETLAESSLRPRLANNGWMLLARQTPAPRLTLTDVSGATFRAVRTLAQGFSQVGLSPAISPNGRLIAYYGRLGASTGIHFFSLDNGQWHPAFVSSKDRHPAFYPDDPLGITDNGMVIYLADDADGNRALWAKQLDIGQPDASPPSSRLLGIGDAIPGNLFAGKVAGLRFEGSVNSLSTTTFLARAEAGVEYILTATGQSSADLMPDVLRLNNDFDEGKIDPASGWALPDLADLAPASSAGTFVRDDLALVFADLPVDDVSLQEAEVFLTLDDNPQNTGKVRFFAVNEATGDWVAIPLDRNLAQDFFHSQGRYAGHDRWYVEGLAQGPVTLRLEYRKDDHFIVREDRGEVAIKQTKGTWQREVRDQIYLQTRGYVDLNHYNPRNPFRQNRRYLQAVYAYYEQLYRQESETLVWPGLAKLAGAQVYAGLSDAEYRDVLRVAIFPLGFVFSGLVDDWSISFQTSMMTINRAIFDDLVWQMRAYQAGGLQALEFAHSQAPVIIEKEGPDGQPNTTDGDVAISIWRKLDRAIRFGDVSAVMDANMDFAYREQLCSVQPVMDKSLNNNPVASWILTEYSKNPVPGARPFIEVVPDGDLTVFKDRWEWIAKRDEGMWAMWTGAPASKRLQWVRESLRDRARRVSFFGLPVHYDDRAP